jgi:predicted transcriptional regulator
MEARDHELRPLRRSRIGEVAESLPKPPRRSTLYYMKTGAVTIRLDPGLEEMLDRVCRDTGRSRSEVVREALRRQLTLELLEEARRQLIPFAEAQGIFTDEDVFKLLS